VVGGYIVDFFCPAANLVIELDGRTHVGRSDEDERRTRFLEQHGLRVIRFTDDEVIHDVGAVVASIAVAAGLTWDSG